MLFAIVLAVLGFIDLRTGFVLVTFLAIILLLLGLSKVKKHSALSVNEDFLKIMAATHHDPFAVLGRHDVDGVATLTVFMPFAESVAVLGVSLGAEAEAVVTTAVTAPVKSPSRSKKLLRQLRCVLLSRLLRCRCCVSRALISFRVRCLRRRCRCIIS